MMKEKSRNRKRSSRKYIIIGIFAILLIYILANTITIYTYSQKDETRQADAAIILGAGVWGAAPSPVFQGRINHGIWLYQNGYVKVLIFTGGYSEGNDFSDASVARAYAIKQGVRTEDIFIEEQSTITQENLYYAKQIMAENSLKNAMIVSDPLHMKRSMLMAYDAGIEAYTSPTPTTRYQSVKSKTTFLAREVFFYIGYKVYRIFKT
jgi:uncharacterized SAM-binding protein YcdF (DUF218 family)